MSRQLRSPKISKKNADTKLEGGGGKALMVVPLRKITFLKLYISYFKAKKVSYATKLEGGGGKALVTGTLKKGFPQPG